MVVAALPLTRAEDLLVARDPLAPADAIVVLAGNAPTRLEHAIELYEQGLAPLIVVSDERVRTHGTDTTWYALYRAGLSAPQLPETALVVLTDPPPESTLDEARRVSRLLSARGARSAILVTDPFHSRRASWLFGAQFRRLGLSLRSSPSEGAVDLSAWLQEPRAGRTVLQEYAKLLWYVPQGAYW